MSGVSEITTKIHIHDSRFPGQHSKWKLPLTQQKSYPQTDILLTALF